MASISRRASEPETNAAEASEAIR